MEEANDGVRLEPEVIARLIEHTLLRPDAGVAEVLRLADEAEQNGFAAVIVHPSFVAVCRERLAGSGVAVGTVIGFPHGATLSEAKAFEAERVQELGATELDMVVHVGRLKERDLDYVRRDIAAVVSVRRAGARVKVILETALLDDAEKVAGAGAAREAGADLVKTSTGFGPGGATVADVALLRRAVGQVLGVKAAGGIRDLDALERLCAAGASRIGTSAGVRILEEARSRRR